MACAGSIGLRVMESFGFGLYHRQETGGRRIPANFWPPNPRTKKAGAMSVR